MGFWDPRGVFFSGIALHKDLTISTSNYPESYKDLLESFNKLKKYPAKFVLSGHGTIITNIKKSISENRRRMRRIDDFIIEQLKKGISTVDEITELFILEKSSTGRLQSIRDYLDRKKQVVIINLVILIVSLVLLIVSSYLLLIPGISGVEALITFHTLMGIIFGVSSVIAMLSIGEGANYEAQEEIKNIEMDWK